MVKNFERVYPNVKIEVQYAPLAQYPALLLTQMQAGNPPDVFQSTPGNLDRYGVFPLAAQGRLLDLSASPWKKRILPVMRRYVSRRGKIYANPVAYVPFVFIYNRDLLRSIGASPPQTFAGLLDVCEKARAAGKLAISTGLASTNSQFQLSALTLGAFVYAKDPDFTLKRVQRKVTWAGSPLPRRSLRALVQMRDAGCFSPGVAGTTTAASVTQFATQQSVMLTASVATRGTVLAINPSLNLGTMTLGGDARGDQRVVMNAITLSGSASTRYPRQARNFIDFVGRVKQSALYSTVSGGLPAYETTKGLLPAYFAGIAPLMRQNKSVMFPAITFPRADIMLPGWASQLVGLFTGQRSIDDIVNNMDTVWDRRP